MVEASVRKVKPRAEESRVYLIEYELFDGWEECRVVKACDIEAAAKALFEVLRGRNKLRHLVKFEIEEKGFARDVLIEGE